MVRWIRGAARKAERAMMEDMVGAIEGGRGGGTACVLRGSEWFDVRCWMLSVAERQASLLRHSSHHAANSLGPLLRCDLQYQL